MQEACSGLESLFRLSLCVYRPCRSWMVLFVYREVRRMLVEVGCFLTTAIRVVNM